MTLALTLLIRACCLFAGEDGYFLVQYNKGRKIEHRSIKLKKL